MDEITAATNANFSNQVSVLVARKAMDSEKEQGQAMVDLIRQSTPPEPRQDGHLHVYA